MTRLKKSKKVLAISKKRRTLKRMKNMQFSSAVWKEKKHYVAQCLNIDVASFGKTKTLALKNLKEALELYLEDASITKISQIKNASIQIQNLSHA